MPTLPNSDLNLMLSNSPDLKKKKVCTYMHTIQWGVASVSGITGRAKVKEQLYARYKSRGGSLALFDFHVTHTSLWRPRTWWSMTHWLEFLLPVTAACGRARLGRAWVKVPNDGFSSFPQKSSSPTRHGRVGDRDSHDRTKPWHWR